MLVNNICYDLCGLVFSLFVITIMLYKKTSVKTLDEKIFVVQITTSLLFGLACIFYYITCIYFNNLTMLAIKLFYITIVLHQASLFLLVASLVLKTNESVRNKYKKSYFYVFCSFIFIIILALLLLKSNSTLNVDNTFHITGSSMKLSYAYTLINTFLLISLLVLNRKHMKDLNLLPFYILMFIYMISASKSFNAFESYTLSYFFFSIIDFVFYMTLENKDIQLINNYNDKKILLENKHNEDNNYMQDICDKLRPSLHSIIEGGFYLKKDTLMSEEEKNKLVNYIQVSSQTLYNNVVNKEVNDDK